MRLKKIINVRDNNVSFDFESIHTYWDCSALAASNIVMVCEGEDGSTWVERNPFTGRESNFDHVLVESIFTQAWTKAQAEMAEAKELFDPDRILIRQLQLMAAISELNLTAEFEAWESSPDRSFMEKAFMRYASHHAYGEPVLTSIFQGLGLTESQSRDLFQLARSLRV